MDIINLFYSFDLIRFVSISSYEHPYPAPLGKGRLGVGFGGGFAREAIMVYPNRVDKSEQQKFLKVKS